MLKLRQVGYVRRKNDTTTIIFFFFIQLSIIIQII